MTRPPSPVRRPVAALLAVTALALAGCSGSSSSSSTTTARRPAAATTTTAAPPTTSAAEAQAWAALDRRVAALAPTVGFLAARVDGGTCEPVHEVEPAAARPIGSQFKLFVLGALAERIAAGDLAWDDTVTVEEADRSFGNGDGSLERVEPGTEVTVEEAATKMISISDNTATDVLIDLLGRDVVEAQARAWLRDPAANEPFLTTKEMFRLHYVPGLAERYLATPAGEREAFLATEVAPLPPEDFYAGLTVEPSHVETIEWFAAPDDVCRAFAGLQDLRRDPALGPLDDVLSLQTAGIDLDPDDWPTLWYKGGSEPGVLSLGWLGVTAEGETYVVEAMVLNPNAPLAESAITDLVEVAHDAFDLLAGNA